jgi:CDP-paratose synthetase
MKNKRILLTGATGFLGSHLLQSLITNNYDVVVLKRSTSDTWRIKNLLKDIECIDVDERSISKAFVSKQIDAVIHTACHYGRDGESASTVTKTNVLFSLLLLEASVKNNVPTFFNTDSFFNVGSKPQKYLEYYSLTKKHFVDWLNIFGDNINIVNMQLQHVYGPNDNENKFATWLLKSMLANIDSIPLTLGNQLRDFIYVGDVVSAFMYRLDMPNKKTSEYYNIGTGKLSTVRMFVETMKLELELYLGVDIKPKLGFGDLITKGSEIDEPKFDSVKSMSLGWHPKYSLKDGLQKTIETECTLSEIIKR